MTAPLNNTFTMHLA